MRRTKLHRSLVQFRTHPLRTALAMLGMVLGVGSVTAMISIGEGAQREILASIEALGGDVLHIKARDLPSEKIPEIVNDSQGLARNDIRALLRLVPGIRSSGYERWLDIAVSDLPGSTYDLKLAAVSPSIFDLRHLDIARGRPLLDVDELHGKRVAVLGADVAARLPGGPEGALEREIRIGYAFFTVVGVLAERRSGGDLPLDPKRYNSAVLVPYAAVAEQVAPPEPYRELDVISLRVAGLDATRRAAVVVAPMLRSLHGGRDDFDVIVPEAILEQKRATQRVLNLVLVCIAAISLVVGGIGVMNILLANILERVGEIGLRRALGASAADIRDQFLLETITVCMVGGGVGVVVGYVATLLVGALFQLPVALAWGATLWSLSLSLCVGLAAGTWPALRAARIHPVEALRRE